MKTIETKNSMTLARRIRRIYGANAQFSPIHERTHRDEHGNVTTHYGQVWKPISSNPGAYRALSPTIRVDYIERRRHAG